MENPVPCSPLKVHNKSLILRTERTAPLLMYAPPSVSEVTLIYIPLLEKPMTLQEMDCLIYLQDFAITGTIIKKTDFSEKKNENLILPVILNLKYCFQKTC